nr:NAD(P)-dependent oxidoreductase [Verrucosispora sp.]
MKTIVISGGTDGIGRALAIHELKAGNQVVVVGRSPEKGRELADEAARLGAADRYHLILADLALVAENRRVAREVAARFSTVDALVLCATYLRMNRAETNEGIEYSFALAYLSRYVLSHEIAPLMAGAPAPVIVNLAVVGAGAKAMNWDDLMFARKHNGMRAWAQTRRANELLGIDFAAHTSGGRIRYVFFNPVFVKSNFSGQFPKPVRFLIKLAGALATPAEKGALPIANLIDNPPAEPLTSYKQAKRVDLPVSPADREDAERLRRETKSLLNE